jgi:hypothetical protein
MEYHFTKISCLNFKNEIKAHATGVFRVNCNYQVKFPECNVVNDFVGQQAARVNFKPVVSLEVDK